MLHEPKILMTYTKGFGIQGLFFASKIRLVNVAKLCAKLCGSIDALSLLQHTSRSNTIVCPPGAASHKMAIGAQIFNVFGILFLTHA